LRIKTKEEVAKEVVEVKEAINADTTLKRIMMIKITMIKDVTRTKTDNMEIPQIKLLEEVKNTKLNTDVN